MRKIAFLLEGEIHPQEDEDVSVFEEMSANELVLNASWVTCTISDFNQAEGAGDG